MCRVLAYLGKPILIENLLYLSDNSFVKQSYHPRLMSYLLNLAGFGMTAWENNSPNPDLPFLYKTLELPFYDKNLHNFSKKISPYCLLAHLRGVAFSSDALLSKQNLHPFIFQGSQFALAHNGNLFDFKKIKYDLLRYIAPLYQKQIVGTTDSEWIYALFISQLDQTKNKYTSQEVSHAVIETLKILKNVRNDHQVTINSPVNLFITNGEMIVATRFVFDFGWEPELDKDPAHLDYHSLWYTYGEAYGFFDDEYRMKGNQSKSSIIIASEPLTENESTWIELPEYTLIAAEQQNGVMKITTQDIDI